MIYEKYISAENKAVNTEFVVFTKFFDKSNKNPYHTNYFDAKPLERYILLLTSGCTSPISSYIFQSGLHDVFIDCDPVVLLENISCISFNSISQADYLLLLSTSKEGLHRCSNKLYGYCAKWGLDVDATELSEVNCIIEKPFY